MPALWREAGGGRAGSGQGLPGPIPQIQLWLVEGCAQGGKNPITECIIAIILAHYIIRMRTLASTWHASLGYFISPQQSVVQRFLRSDTWVFYSPR